MVNYQNGKIYKLICNKTGLCYIGSTTKDYLSKRLVQHRNMYKLWKNGNKHYFTSFKIIENDDYDIILLENYSCNSKDELHSRERYYIENNECVNKYIPTRTQKEYHKKYNDEHKQEIKKYGKKYYEEHKEELKEQRKEKITCECGSTIRKSDKAKHEKSIKHKNYLNSLTNVEHQENNI